MSCILGTARGHSKVETGILSYQSFHLGCISRFCTYQGSGGPSFSLHYNLRPSLSLSVGDNWGTWNPPFPVLAPHSQHSAPLHTLPAGMAPSSSLVFSFTETSQKRLILFPLCLSHLNMFLHSQTFLIKKLNYGIISHIMKLTIWKCLTWLAYWQHCKPPATPLKEPPWHEEVTPGW